ncbi:hypothetical protein FIBSPDRAFT_79492 [Athelia psychrophila]|uniref:Uncharacterized protein n=1 Tax=Athelia psychrophila TaxID=1759441 RepID=A0A166E8Q9_9AGAM|nr:hypothetical protein FIBSPDRAFT_79492 [Fibularhizoctonia sp. CBS 109695]
MIVWAPIRHHVDSTKLLLPYLHQELQRPPDPRSSRKPDFNYGPIIRRPESSRVLNIHYILSPANHNLLPLSSPVPRTSCPSTGSTSPPPTPLYAMLAVHTSQCLHSLAISAISDADACDIGPVNLTWLFFLHYGRAEAHTLPPTLAKGIQFGSIGAPEDAGEGLACVRRFSVQEECICRDRIDIHTGAVLRARSSRLRVIWVLPSTHSSWKVF